MTKIKDRVYAILEKYPETRNCDATLVTKYWEEYDTDHLMWVHYDGQKVVLPFHKFKDVTWPSTIERWRRHIQNKMHRFPPTDRSVAKKRRMNMEKWEEMMIAKIPDTL